MSRQTSSFVSSGPYKWNFTGGNKWVYEYVMQCIPQSSELRAVNELRSRKYVEKGGYAHSFCDFFYQSHNEYHPIVTQFI